MTDDTISPAHSGSNVASAAATPPRQWRRGTYLISTSKALLDLAAINDAFHSDALYWAHEYPRDVLARILENSLCFGLYEMPPQIAEEVTGRSGRSQIGFARVITDQVTFEYLTDVYILPAYQGDGLGSWLAECVNEELEGWQDLRRAMCVTSLEKGKEFYEKTMGMKPFEPGPKGMAVLTKRGKGSAF